VTTQFAVYYYYYYCVTSQNTVIGVVQKPKFRRFCRAQTGSSWPQPPRYTADHPDNTRRSRLQMLSLTVSLVRSSVVSRGLFIFSINFPLPPKPELFRRLDANPPRCLLSESAHSLANYFVTIRVKIVWPCALSATQTAPSHEVHC